MTTFNIHQKLKDKKSTVTYLFIAHESEVNVKNKLITSYDESDEMEFALYTRDGNYFILVDFFNDVSEACEEAIEIIKNSAFKKQFF